MVSSGLGERDGKVSGTLMDNSLLSDVYGSALGALRCATSGFAFHTAAASIFGSKRKNIRLAKSVIFTTIIVESNRRVMRLIHDGQYNNAAEYTFSKGAQVCGGLQNL